MASTIQISHSARVAARRLPPRHRVLASSASLASSSSSTLAVRPRIASAQSLRPSRRGLHSSPKDLDPSPLQSTARQLSSPTQTNAKASATSQPRGPIQRYEELVEAGILTDDDFQRRIITKLQGLHSELRDYKQQVKEVPGPVDGSSGGGLGGFFSKLLGGGKAAGAAEELELPTNMPKGMYLYGDVGTGKSMLMDLFYDMLPPNITRKRRVHFHQFMIDAHKRMHAFKLKHHKPSGMVMSGVSTAFSKAAAAATAVGGGGPAGGRLREAVQESIGEEVDPIPTVAREFADEASVLCFDEFQVTDIADAMILRRLMEHMLYHGVVCVMTSNRHPDELYKNGIQRSSFLPCIELLKTRLAVTDLNSGTDYRKVPRALSKVYLSPLSDENKREMDKIFEAFTSDPSDPLTINRELSIWGRKLKVPQSTKNVARFTFMELCGQPRSAADYIEICNTFDTVFVDEVPRMGLHERDLARRLITFIDAAYEAKVKLFASSEVPILQIFSSDKTEGPTKDAMRSLMDDLGLTMQDLGGSPIFTGEEELFAFARVISRLTEMGSKHYAELAANKSREAPPHFDG